VSAALDGSEQFPSLLGSPFSVSMWDFSWLLRRFGTENEYGSWERVLDEAVERGYQCLRIDAFPHLVAASPSKDTPFTVLPQPPQFMWGNHEPVDVHPASALVEFVGLAKQRGLGVALSSWWNDDSTHQVMGIREPADYVRVWSSTLRTLDQAKLLDCVIWVDLCNEWPLRRWAPAAYDEIFGAPTGRWDGHDVLHRPWTDGECSKIETYLSATSRLRAQYPDLAFTFSLLDCPGLRQIDLGSLDLLEVHEWLTEDPEFARSTAFAAVQEGGPETLAHHLRLAYSALTTEPQQWLNVADARRAAWADLAAHTRKPLVTTEGWASVWCGDVPPDQPGWSFTKTVGSAAVRNALKLGWKGVCTSNFSQPHFRELWNDLGWHRKLTNLIRNFRRE